MIREIIEALRLKLPDLKNVTIDGRSLRKSEDPLDDGSRDGDLDIAPSKGD